MWLLGSTSEDLALLLGYQDGAFPEEHWPDVWMKNLHLYLFRPLDFWMYFKGYVGGYVHRKQRMAKLGVY